MLRELPVRQRGQCCEVDLDLKASELEQTVGTLRALADPTRLQIVAALLNAQQPVCVCDFTGAFELSQPTVSHHIGILRRAGLIESTKRGLWVHYRLAGNLPLASRRLIEAAIG